MSKVILEFNLPEEQSEFKKTINGIKYFSALFKFENKLKNLIKYSKKEFMCQDTVEHIQNCYYQILHDDNIDLNE